jgi:hypothetical protein
MSIFLGSVFFNFYFDEELGNYKGNTGSLCLFLEQQGFKVDLFAQTLLLIFGGLDFHLSRSVNATFELAPSLGYLYHR